VVLAQMYALATFMWSPFGFFLPGQTPKLGQVTMWPVCLTIIVGVLGSIYQFMFNTGAMRTPAGLGSMMRNTDIIMSFVWQVLIFGQEVTLLSVIGSLLIIAATVGIAIKKLREDRKSRRNEPKMQLVSQDSQIDDVVSTHNIDVGEIELHDKSSISSSKVPRFSTVRSPLTVSSVLVKSKTVLKSDPYSRLDNEADDNEADDDDEFEDCIEYGVNDNFETTDADYSLDNEDDERHSY
jgi:hypothetical protein